VQYEVVDEDAFCAALGRSHVALVESANVLTTAEQAAVKAFKGNGGTLVVGDGKHWQDTLHKALPHPALTLEAPKTVRAVVRDTDTATAVFLHNLHIERLSSYEDRVTPAENLTVSVLVPFKDIKSVRVSTADEGIPSGLIEYTAKEEDNGVVITMKIPRLDVAMMLTVEKGAA
jgi:hypothetical protein